MLFAGKLRVGDSRKNLGCTATLGALTKILCASHRAQHSLGGHLCRLIISAAILGAGHGDCLAREETEAQGD